MSKVQKLPPRSAVKPGRLLGPRQPLQIRRGLGNGVQEMGSPHSGLRAIRRPSGREPEIAGRLPGVRSSISIGPAERLGTYAHLKVTEDNGDSTYQRMLGRFQHASSEAGQIGSYIRPEILAIPTAKMKKFLAAPELAPHRLSARTPAALQAAHAQLRRRKAAGHAKPDGGNGEPRVPPVERRRSEIRQREEREGQAGRIEQCVAIGVPAFAVAQCPQDGLPSILRRISGPRKHARRNALRLDPARCLLRQGPRLPERSGRRTVSPTTCRRRSTTT